MQDTLFARMNLSIIAIGKDGADMRKLIKKNYRRLVAMILTTVLTFVNVGTNLTVAFAADDAADNLFLISGEDLKEAIDQVKDGDEQFDYSSLNVMADKSVRKTYQKLLKGNVYQLDVPVDDAYAGEHASVDVFYNADMETVVFLYANSGEYRESFAVNIDGYETKRMEVKAFEEIEGDADTEIEDDTDRSDAAEIPEENGTSADEADVPETPADEADVQETSAGGDETEESEKEQIEAAISVHQTFLVGNNAEAAEVESAEEENTEIEMGEEETTEAEGVGEETTEADTSDDDAVEADPAETDDSVDLETEETGDGTEETEDETETTGSEAEPIETDPAETEDETGTTETTESDITETMPTEPEDIEGTTAEDNPGQPESGKMDGQLLLDDDYEVLDILDGKEYPGITIWEGVSARAYSVKLSVLSEIPGMDGEEAAFDESYVASNDVVINVRAKAGVLPEGTTLEVKEITSEVESSVKEKMAEEGNMVEVLAYDIMLVLDGEVLSNDWSDAGSGVVVTFRGQGIQEKAEKAAAVQVLHADTLDGSLVEEASADQLRLDDEGRELIRVTDEKVEEVSFDASHFSVYVIAFVKDSTETTGTLTVVQTVMGTTADESENPAGTISVDSGKELAVADILYENSFSSYNAGEGNTFFAYATAVSDETAERIAKVRAIDSKVQYLSGTEWKDFGTDAVLYLWYTDMVARIGDDRYDTLDKAIEAVDAASEIVLLADAEITVNAITKPVTILGDGHIVSVPRQAKTDSGGLEIQDVLSFKNTRIRFKEDVKSRNWSAALTKKGQLNILDSSECIFEQTGVYASPNTEINISGSSSMFLENMEYTCIMGEAYPYLNIMDGSSLTIKKPMGINGITGFKIAVDASELSITGCENQGYVKCDLILTNGATADISNNGTGCNLFGGNQLIVNEGTMLTLNNNKGRALMTQGNERADVLVKSGGTLIVSGNGSKWKNTDDEAKYYAEKSAITIGVYGWYDGYGIMTYRKHMAIFEDGANVDISNNYTRGISNWGTVEIGSGTRIVNNGMLDSGDRSSCRVATGGGVYNAGIMTVADGVELYNNHANTSADDIYNAVNLDRTPKERGEITFGQVGQDWYLDGEPDCTDKISGWYDDAADARWEAHGEPYHLVKAEPGNYKVTSAIKAAHGILYVVSYDLQGGTYQGSPTVADASYPVDDSVAVIADPEREGYVFTGWTVTVDNTEVPVPDITGGIFTMPGANVLLTANWKLQETTYTINHIYTTTTKTYDADGNLVSSKTVEDGRVTDANKPGVLGAVIRASEHYQTTYQNAAYAVSSKDDVITLGSNAAENVITITYTRTLEEHSQNPTPDPTPDDNRPSGGGSSGGSGGGPNTNTSTPAGGPGVPSTEIVPEPVPLAVLPETAPQAGVIIIEDEEVPLAALPKTGDRGRRMEWMFMLSGSLLAACTVFGKKREEEQ